MAMPIRRVSWRIIAITTLFGFSCVAAAVRPPAVHDNARKQAPVTCVDAHAGQPRPATGCFNLAHVAGLHFGARGAVWNLYRFSSRAAAEAARSGHGVVVQEAGSFWLSEIAPAGTPAARHAAGSLAASVGPLRLPKAASYTATLAYAVMSPGQRSRIHTHPGPEAFYVVAGEQCVATPDCVRRAHAGQSFSEPAGAPMELVATGSTLRQGFALVIHDSTMAQAAATAWRSAGRCGN